MQREGGGGAACSLNVVQQEDHGHSGRKWDLDPLFCSFHSRNACWGRGAHLAAQGWWQETGGGTRDMNCWETLRSSEDYMCPTSEPASGCTEVSPGQSVCESPENCHNRLRERARKASSGAMPVPCPLPPPQAEKPDNTPHPGANAAAGERLETKLKLRLRWKL